MKLRPRVRATAHHTKLPAPRSKLPDLRRVHLTIVISAITALGLWAYWPTLCSVVETWNREPDYTHGFLVPPLAILFLWMRRSQLPSGPLYPEFGGLVLIVLSLVIRAAGAIFYVDSLDAWSIPIWMAGTVWLLGGQRLLAWSWPAIVFLFFAAPWPWRVERFLSWPLQRVAAESTAWILQLLGQPASAMGNTLLVGGTRLEVAEACTGLRMFLGMTAVAYACAALTQRPWWQKGLLLLAAVPVALMANVARITATGLLHEVSATNTFRPLVHDAAGWLMIPLGVCLFGLLLWWLDRAFENIEPATSGELLQRRS